MAVDLQALVGETLILKFVRAPPLLPDPGLLQSASSIFSRPVRCGRDRRRNVHTCPREERLAGRGWGRAKASCAGVPNGLCGLQGLCVTQTLMGSRASLILRFAPSSQSST